MDPVTMALIYSGAQMLGSYFQGQQAQRMMDEQKHENYRMGQYQAGMNASKMANDWNLGAAGLAARFGAPGQRVTMKYTPPPQWPGYDAKQGSGRRVPDATALLFPTLYPSLRFAEDMFPGLFG